MSLKHWWPLNGDPYDRCSGTPLTGNIVFAAGPTGKCLSTNVEHRGSFTIGELDAVDHDFTLSCWVKISRQEVYNWFQSKSITSGTPTGSILGYNHYGGVSLTWITTSINTDLQIQVRASLRGADSNYYFGPIYTLPDNTWTHILVMHMASEKRCVLFINGASFGFSSTAACANIGNTSQRFGINVPTVYSGNGPQLSIPMKIADVRVYDHVTSMKEIKEMTSMLVCHYPFNNKSIEQTTNLITGLKAGGRTTYNAANKSITTAGLNQDTYFYLQTSEPIVEGQIYTLQCMASGIGDGKQFMFGMQGQSSSHHNFKIVDGYNEYTFQANSYINGLSEILMDDTNRTGWESQAKFYNFQLEKRDHGTPYAESSRPLSITNMGVTTPVATQNVSLVATNARRGLALNCIGSTYIATSMDSELSQRATVMMWVYVDPYPVSSEVVFADPNSKLAFGFYGTNNAIISCGGVSSNVVAVGSYWKKGEWNHVCVTKDNSNFSLYLNGTLIPASTSTNNWTASGNMTIGCRYSGSYNTFSTCLVDDFRLYYRTLTEDDIALCYKGRLSIDNMSRCYTTMYSEETNKNQLALNGCYSTNTINEYPDLPRGYTQLEYIENTGSQYIDTGLPGTTKLRRINTRFYHTTNQASQILFGVHSYYFFYREHDAARPNYGMYAGSGNYIQTSIPMAEGYVDGSIVFDPAGTASISITQALNNGTVNKQTKTDTFVDNWTKSYTHYLFGYNYDGSSVRYNFPCRMMSFQIIGEDGCLRNFVPCKNSSGVAGMYDTVTKQFYGNAGSGTFTAGPEAKAYYTRNNSMACHELNEI